MAGNIPVMRLASIVLPEPGAPIIMRPNSPVAATAMPRFAISCPQTSEKSSINSGAGRGAGAR